MAKHFLVRLQSNTNSSKPTPQKRKRQRPRRLHRLSYEQLESRFLLAADLSDLRTSAVNSSSYAPMTWFDSYQSVQRVPLDALASVDRLLPTGVAGPTAPAVGEWIVQLTDSASSSLRALNQANALLNTGYSDFSVISGLGTKGLLLVRGHGATKAVIESSLQQNENVVSYSLNQLIEGQSTSPNDPEYVAGLMPGMERIDATNAWDVSRGSMSTVVGVVDTGIDPTHPDLYLNIWINQGELPPSYLGDTEPRLTDVDKDGLITFYDLNNVTRSTTAPYKITEGGFSTGPNASFVVDRNSNGRIDAIDLLEDPNWADGRDTDGNGFFDDFFGVNFRTGATDPFASNNPSDELGHGTHVAGTIGAIGSNDIGVVGVNWQTSLMSLRILDNNNQGDSGAAIRAVNYAREMREQYRVSTTGRVTQGANIRVLNNSWGQPGGYEVSLEAAIRDSTDAGILFVAAAGNGNFLGQGVDNNKTPFYPASYNLPGVIAVAASDLTDSLATFSNYGSTSVDLLAPGVGIRSTLPGGSYSSATGTSMATPHVSGTAALVWSAFPEATVAEVRSALLNTVDPISNGNLFVSSGGRLSASKSINADVFAPAARLVSKQDVTTAGGPLTEFKIEYTHRSGINTATIGNDDLIVTRQWGQSEPLVVTLKPNSIITTSTTASATYILTAPGGSWDVLDFGDYVISTVAGKVTSLVGNKTTEARDIGNFNVRIDDSSVLYVTSFNDSLEPGTLRSQIIAANTAAPAPRTIILESGKYTIDIPAIVDPASTFGTSLVSLGINNPGGWNNATTGDFDIQGNITIIGDVNDETIIDAQGIDRAFKIHANATTTLSRLSIQRGISPPTQGGGGILSIGTLNLEQAILKKNAALGIDSSNPIYGGAIASWNGTTSINKSWLTENQANFGGAIFYNGTASSSVQRSTVDNNTGGGIYSLSTTNSIVENSTFSSNTAGYGAIANLLSIANSNSSSPSLSGDGRYVAFESDANNLVPGDTNGLKDIFIYDQINKLFELVTVSKTDEQGTIGRNHLSLSADGRYLTFASLASNLVPGDTNGVQDIFVYDRMTKLFERVSVNETGGQANRASDYPSISADGQYVTFRSRSTNLVPGEGNSVDHIFVHNRITKSIERVSVSNSGIGGDGISEFPSLSADGQYVTFGSYSTNLVPGDTNGTADIFVYDRNTKLIERVSVSENGVQGDSISIQPSISGNGRFVTFASDASNLVIGDTNPRHDLFVYDRTLKSIERIRLGLTSVGHDWGNNPMISLDGQYVTFFSNAFNLVLGDTNERRDIFVYDRTTKLTERINLSDSGMQGNGFTNVGTPSISADGRFVTFHSDANNLIPNDTNGFTDIFVYDRSTKRINSITYKPISSSIDISNSTIAFTSDTSFNGAVYGDIKVANSLFVSNAVQEDLISRYPSGSSYNNIFSTTPQSSLVSSLQRIGTQPPVHYLVLGNPAINSASSESIGSLDQLGQERVTPDIGAVEATVATAFGKVYVDSNRNGRLDFGESGISSVAININGPTLGLVKTNTDDPKTPFVDEAGTFTINNLLSGTYEFSAQNIDGFSNYKPGLEVFRTNSSIGSQPDEIASVSFNGRYLAFQSNAPNLVTDDTNIVTDIFLYDRTTKLIERISKNITEGQGNGSSIRPSISSNGQFVTFVSNASNLVTGDTNNVADTFVFDRVSKLIDRVSVQNNGIEGNGASASNFPSISSDGRFVTFGSAASNLVNGDGNGKEDIFVYDRTMRQIERISVSNAGIDSDGDSFTPSISADGRFVTFTSIAKNLVLGDSNDTSDVFLYDRTTKQIELVSKSEAGVQANSVSNSPSLSNDGRFVTFQSRATNLVPEETIAFLKTFVFDRTTKQIELISVNSAGEQLNGTSDYSQLSSDGRYVTFRSFASNLIDGDTNNNGDIFVYDRAIKRVARVNVSDGGQQANSFSENPSISGDGRFITFRSNADNLFPGDDILTPDLFIVPNPLVQPGGTIDLLGGQVSTDLNIGFIANPGIISGRVFEDIVENKSFDIGEPSIANTVVFLDLNANGLLDAGERSVVSAADGSYQFQNTDSYRTYSVMVKIPIGIEQIAPSTNENFAWNIFLPAGGAVTDRDFAMRRIQSTGQSNVSAVSGRLYDDRNGNKVYDAGDTPIVNKEVYLDATNFGVRDTNEPRVLTDAQGLYSITGLSSRTVAISTTLDSSLVHVTPLGSKFTLQKLPLYDRVRQYSNPQAITSGDFNQDGFLDVAVANKYTSTLSIRINNRLGGFFATEIDIELGVNGVGPTSLVVGQFDNDPKVDVALTAFDTSKVIVLLNFNPVSNAFSSQSAVNVGLLPFDIAAGQFSGDSKIDLVVVNQGTMTIPATVQVLTNNGSGGFTAGPGIPTGGIQSVSIVAGNFTGDSSTDVALVHFLPQPTHGTNGGVTILRGNGFGGLTLEPNYYQVGNQPTDSVLTDFNGDGRADVAVANSGTNSISILLGQSNGIFRVQSSILGTARGVSDITFGDIDNDGDIDLIAGNLNDFNISIFRNSGIDSTTGEVQFEPLENIGLGQIEVTQRMPLVVGNFDNDRSGPGGTGTLDIIAIPQRTNTLNVLTNRLVNGSRRVALTGLNTVTGIDFIIKSALLPPSMNVIDNPLPILEDAEQQTVPLTGIVRGRAGGPPLRITASSSQTSVIASATIQYTDLSTTGSLLFTPVTDASGTSILTVTLTDAGADQLMDTADDGILSRSFTVTVLPVNDRPTFSFPADRTVSVNEDAGSQSIPNFVTNITRGGGAYELGQALSAFTVSPSSIHAALFQTAPAIDTNGRLTFTGAPNASGSATVFVTLKDNGGRENNGLDTLFDLFQITFNPVNDAPSITIGNNQTSQANSGAKTIAGFATGFHSGGGSFESAQIISEFIVTNDNPALFISQPTIDTSGTLRYTPSATTGTANVSVRVRDNGGTLSGGVDLSAISNFTIAITTNISVVNRQIFYNRSTNALFGNGSGNPINAIDSSKPALLPGQKATFANYINYSRGLNGMVVDIAGATGTLRATDFQFAVWDGINVAGFVASSAVPTVTHIAAGGLGGSTRAKIEFADNAIKNTWLRITVLANANTGLATNDVFYFGHAMADMNVGNSLTADRSQVNVKTNQTDLISLHNFINRNSSQFQAGITNLYDLNKDGKVNNLDIALVGKNQSNSRIRTFTAPASLARSHRATSLAAEDADQFFSSFE